MIINLFVAMFCLFVLWIIHDAVFGTRRRREETRQRISAALDRLGGLLEREEEGPRDKRSVRALLPAGPDAQVQVSITMGGEFGFSYVMPFRVTMRAALPAPWLPEARACAFVHNPVPRSEHPRVNPLGYTEPGERNVIRVGWMHIPLDGAVAPSWALECVAPGLGHLFHPPEGDPRQERAHVPYETVGFDVKVEHELRMADLFPMRKIDITPEGIVAQFECMGRASLEDADSGDVRALERQLRAEDHPLMANSGELHAEEHRRQLFRGIERAKWLAPRMMEVVRGLRGPEEFCRAVITSAEAPRPERLRALRVLLTEHAPDHEAVLRALDDLRAQPIDRLDTILIWGETNAERTREAIPLEELMRRLAHHAQSDATITAREAKLLTRLLPDDPALWWEERLPEQLCSALVSHQLARATTAEVRAHSDRLRDLFRDGASATSPRRLDTILMGLMINSAALEVLMSWEDALWPHLEQVCVRALETDQRDVLDVACPLLARKHSRAGLLAMRAWLERQPGGVTGARGELIAHSVQHLTETLGASAMTGGLSLAESQGGDLSLADDGAGGLSLSPPPVEP